MRDEMVKKYESPTEWTTERVISYLLRSPAAQKAVEIFYQEFPDIKADTQLRNTDAPFELRHSGVSYPFNKNDATQVPGRNITYGDLCLEIAEQTTSGLKNP